MTKARTPALQRSFDTGDTDDVVLYLFDLPYFDGHDLRDLPLEQRRAVLEKLLLTAPSDRVRFSETFDAVPDGVVGTLMMKHLKGLHVVVPVRRVHDWDTVKGFSQAIVQHMAQTITQRFVARSGRKNRVGKIFSTTCAAAITGR